MRLWAITGIITKAQDANFKNGIAVLEEFLQQKYVENYESLDNENVDYTPIEILVKKYPEYFFSDGTKDYVIEQVSYVDNEGITQNEFLKIRLIRKNNLPDEIKNALSGGNAGSTAEYEQFMDVYGVTSDLKIFYCSNGLASAVGADYYNSDLYDSTKVLYASNSTFSKIIASLSGSEAKDLTLTDLYQISELKIDATSGITDLSDLANLKNLTTLTLTNYVGSLKGIERAYNLTSIYFNNEGGTQNIDYTGFSGATKLTQIKFYMPTDSELEKMCTEMAKADYEKLSNLYLVGYWDGYWEQYSSVFTNSNPYSSECGLSSLSTISYLNKLSVITKKSVIKITIAATKITSLNGLEGFTNITFARLSSNYLVSVDELSKMTNLYWLDLSNNTTLTSILGIESLTNLYNVYIRNCIGITDISALVKNSLPNGINGTDCNNLDFSTTIWTEKENALLTKLGKVNQLFLPDKYSLLFLNKDYITLSADNTWDEVKVLKGKTTLQYINFNGNKNLTDANIQELLVSLPNINSVNLDSTNLQNLNWVSGKTNLIRISFEDTLVTDIISLYGNKSLGYIRFNNAKATVVLYKDDVSEDLTEEEKTVATEYNNKIINIIETAYDKRVNPDSYNIMGTGGGFVPRASVYFTQINKLTKLTKFAMVYWNLPNYGFDFSNTSLKEIYLNLHNFSTIKVPKTIEVIESVYLLYFEADEITNLKELKGNGMCVVICNNIRTVFDDTQNGTSVKFRGDAANSLSNLDGYLGGYIGSFEYEWSYRGTKYGSFSSAIFSEMINCNSVYVSCKSVSRLNGTDFANYTRDFSLTLNGMGITTFDNVNSALHLVTLNLTNNKIVDVSFFLNNIENSKISSLTLSNNLLENITTYKDASGTSVTESTCAILARLPKLTYVDLSGNTNLTDFSALTNAGFKETGNNTKIFEKK